MRLELDKAVDGREQRIISPTPYVLAGVNAIAYLPHDNRAGANLLTVVTLDAEPLARAVLLVRGATATFFVCHLPLLPK